MVGRRPRRIGFTPDGRYAYVACELDSTVYVIDIAARSVSAKLAAGEYANGVIVAPGRGWGPNLYVANGRSNSVSVIDTRLGLRIADISVGDSPWGVAIR